MTKLYVILTIITAIATLVSPDPIRKGQWALVTGALILMGLGVYNG